MAVKDAVMLDSIDGLTSSPMGGVVGSVTAGLAVWALILALIL